MKQRQQKYVVVNWQ